MTEKLPINFGDNGRVARDKINDSFNEVVERVAGYRPHIENGYWWIGDNNTGVKAEGKSASFRVFNGYIEYSGDDGVTREKLIAVEDLKGDKGDKGDTGPQGPQGIQGQQGVKGDTGPQGEQGIQGIKGDTGNGITTTALNPDYTLTINYSDGRFDTTGNIRGAKGDKGDKGDQGIQGIQGIQGETGNGIANTSVNPDYTLTVNYTNGESYTSGSIRGAKGEQGVQGIQGIQGIQGEKGDKGDTGEQGIQGVQGPQGIQGETGPQGEQGIKGDKGDKGDQGIQGIQGVKGDPGAKGDKGDTGPQGPTGNGIASIDVVKSGKTNTITITETNGTVKELTVQDGADGEGSGDMSMATYDPSGKMADVFNAQNHYNLDTELSNTSEKAVQNKVITAKINDIELSKAPNVSIVGTPTINQGNISGFSTSNYLIAPFLSSFAGYPFTFHIDITTSNDVATQQNIIDAEFGMAFAIRSGKFVIALSTTGTSWDLGETTGTYTVKANQSYCIEIAWSGTAYTVKYSVDRVNFYTDITVNSSSALSGNTLYLGGHGVTDHPFKGIFNFNEWEFLSGTVVVWKGMDDAGLSTRANLSLSNLNAQGEARFNEKANLAGGNNFTGTQSFQGGASIDTNGYVTGSWLKTTANNHSNTTATEIFVKQNNWLYTRTADEIKSDLGITGKLDKTQIASSSQDGVLSKEDYSTFSAKQGAISDLETIRSGASKGATALQSETDPVYSKSPSATITTNDISNWNGKGTYSKPSGGIPKTDLASTVQTSLGKADTALQSFTETDPVFGASPAKNIQSTDITNWNGKYAKPSGGIPKTDLASAVQTSLGKADTALQSFTESDPTVPSHVKGITTTDIENWNGKGTYSKPTGGIPKTDLASAVQTSLGKADSALQSFTETDPTVPSHVKSITSSDINNWNSKQNSIADLVNIRTGAELGATSVQPGTLTTELNKKQNTISDLAAIRAGASKGATALQSSTITGIEAVSAEPSSRTQGVLYVVPES